MTETTIPLVDSHRALSLFGARDQHVRTIREVMLFPALRPEEGREEIEHDDESVAAQESS